MGDTKIEKVKISSIAEDAVTTLNIGGTFYQRLNKLLVDYGDSVDKSVLMASMAKIQRGVGVEKDHYAFNLETLMILLRDVELAFQADGHVKDEELNIEVPIDYKETKMNDTNQDQDS